VSSLQISSQHANAPKKPIICCVGGGKGGTGKSILALNLAYGLAQQGMKVVLADLDLGGANLHTLLGIRHCEATIRDFFGGRVKSLSELLLSVKDLGFSLLPGGDEVAGVVGPGFQRKQKLSRHLSGLDADVVICDLGGNSGIDTLDIFNEADFGIVVSTAEPTAIQNAYGFIKAALLRKIWRVCPTHSRARELLDHIWDPSAEQLAMSVPQLIASLADRDPEVGAEVLAAVKASRLELLVNQASVEEGKRVYSSLAGVARTFLDLELVFLGHIASDSRIPEAVLKSRPPVLGDTLFSRQLWEQLSRRFESAMAIGINEEIRIPDDVLHVQTEDLGSSAAAFLCLVYSGGRVLLSKRVAYDSIFWARFESSPKHERIRFLHATVVQAIRSGRIDVSTQASNTVSCNRFELQEGNKNHVA
jgi:flagellar biosynthesis protein FlhG